eukprot:s1967_g5.t1
MWVAIGSAPGMAYGVEVDGKVRVFAWASAEAFCAAESFNSKAIGRCHHHLPAEPSLRASRMSASFSSSACKQAVISQQPLGRQRSTAANFRHRHLWECLLALFLQSRRQALVVSHPPASSRSPKLALGDEWAKAFRLPPIAASGLRACELQLPLTFSQADDI